ncbi:MAG: homocysteine biosynthesis protein [Cyanobacteriota bacterium]|nr:homocysteine biosynthesis protein [Cyanobacteriota bacterium]
MSARQRPLSHFSTKRSRQAPARTESTLLELQAAGDLLVRTAGEFRTLVAREGLEQAFASTHVLAVADAGFTDQFSIHLALGPSDPPIRFQRVRLDGVDALCGSGSGELVLPAEGAPILGALLNGRSVRLAASGAAGTLHPRDELHTTLRLDQIGVARLVLHRAIAENAIVAVSSAPGLTPTGWGPLLGGLGSALYGCAGAGSIGFTMPGLAQLGPGSPVLVAGGIGWVVGAGGAHQPGVPRSPLGHALAPGASAAVSVDLHGLDPAWLRACRFEGHGAGLLVATAAPVALLTAAMARQAAAGADRLVAPVIDLGIPRRLKPMLDRVSYADLERGRFVLQGRTLRCAPAFSPRLAEAFAEHLALELREGRFPLRQPLRPLGSRPTLIPLEP